MVEDLINLSMSGIYSLLILNLTFSFLLAIRLNKMQGNTYSLSDSVEKEMSLLKQRIDSLEEGK